MWCFLSIAVIIKLLCGHWTDVCSQGRSMSQYEANRGTCVSYFECVIPVLFYNVVIIKTLNKWEKNLTMGIALVIIFFWLPPCNLICCVFSSHSILERMNINNTNIRRLWLLNSWSLKYCVFSELHLLTEKKIGVNGYGYLEKIIPILCQ